MFRSIRTAFITGLIFLLPIIITITALDILLDMGGTPASRFFFGIDSDIDLNKLELWKQKVTSSDFINYSIYNNNYSWLLIENIPRPIFLKEFRRYIKQVPLINLIYIFCKTDCRYICEAKGCCFSRGSSIRIS